MRLDELEKELDKWRHSHFNGARDDHFSGEYLERTSQLDLARHFIEWSAEFLREKIEKVYKSEIHPWLSGVSAASAIYDYVLPLIDSLKQEQPEENISKGFKEGDIIIERKVGMHGEPIEIVLDKYAQRARGIFPGDELTIILRTKR